MISKLIYIPDKLFFKQLMLYCTYSLWVLSPINVVLLTSQSVNRSLSLPESEHFIATNGVLPSIDSAKYQYDLWWLQVPETKCRQCYIIFVRKHLPLSNKTFVLGEICYIKILKTTEANCTIFFNRCLQQCFHLILISVLKCKNLSKTVNINNF